MARLPLKKPKPVLKTVPAVSAHPKRAAVDRRKYNAKLGGYFRKLDPAKDAFISPDKIRQLRFAFESAVRIKSQETRWPREQVIDYLVNQQGPHPANRLVFKSPDGRVQYKLVLDPVSNEFYWSSTRRNVLKNTK